MADPGRIDGRTGRPGAHPGARADVESGGEEQVLDRVCLDYRFRLEGDEDAVPFATEVRWLVAGGYLLRRELRDADNPGRWLTSEVVELAEGDGGIGDGVVLG